MHAIPIGYWENALRAALHPKSLINFLKKLPAQGDPIGSLRSVMVISGETPLENYHLLHVRKEKDRK